MKSIFTPVGKEVNILDKVNDASQWIEIPIYLKRYTAFRFTVETWEMKLHALTEKDVMQLFTGHQVENKSIDCLSTLSK
jgi:hypothetical protein